MTKSASRNSTPEQNSKDKHQVTVAFLIIQAIIFMCLLIYYYDSIGPLVITSVLLWSMLSLGLAAMQLRGRLMPQAPYTMPEANTNAAGSYIFGIPGKRLDLAALCTIMQEGAALLKHGQIIFVNPALAYILAAQEEEIIGTRISSYVHPEDVALINLEGGMHSDGPSRATLRLNTRLGDVRWVICSVHNVDWHDEDAVLLLFENIGPLKQAQQALAELEHQSRILLERTPLGIAMFDSMGQLKLSNTAWHALWSSIVGNGGRRFNILQDPFLPNTPVERAIRQAFNKKDAGISNFEHAAPWGETRWLNLNFHPMSDPMGRLIGVAMIQQDITDQIRSVRRENELNDQLTSLRQEVSYTESFLHQVQDKSDHVIISFEQDGTIASWNNYAELRFGLPESKAVGMNYRNLSADFSPYIPLIQQAITQKNQCTLNQIKRIDSSGPHCEKVLVDTAQIGLDPVILLRIKDITHEVMDKSMHALLQSIEALSGMGRSIEASRDISAEEKWKALAASVSALSPQEDKQPRQMSYIPLGELMDAVMQSLSQELGSGFKINGEYADSALEIFTSPELVATALCDLGTILAGLIPEGEERAIKISQSRDKYYAIINMEIAAKDLVGVTDFQQLQACISGDRSCLTRDSHIKDLVGPLRTIYAAGGLIGGYSVDNESGFVCRFLLPGVENPQVECK